VFVQASSSAQAAADTRTLAEQLGGLTRRLFLDPHADHLGAIERHELTLTQVRALLLVASEEEATSAGTVAERLGLSPAAITRALDALVARGLVNRRECSDDRRVRLVRATDAGRAIVDELAALRSAGLERFVGGLTSDQRELLSAALAALSDPDGDQ
jgi:DNA-binding MarR family transcriptional regulator